MFTSHRGDSVKQTAVMRLKMAFGSMASLAAIGLTFNSALANQSATYGDWAVQCDTQGNCTMSQVAVVGNNDKPLMQIDLVLGEPNERRVVIVLPLGTALDLSPKLYLESSLIAELNVKFCLTDGCYYSLPLDDALLEKFLSMRSGSLVVRSHKDEPFDIPISGKGSRATFNYYREQF